MTEHPIRKHNRLQNYDYSQNGGYFVTICTKNRKPILWQESVGAIINRPQDSPPLTEIGCAVDAAIQNIPRIYPGISLEKYVVMPNHIHLLLLFTQYHGRLIIAPTNTPTGADGTRTPATLPNVIRQMKTHVTKQVGYNIWQKGYHDHVIRTQGDFLQIWTYIDENPLKWQLDCYFHP